MTEINKSLRILQHSLGVDKYGKGRQYRNHFCTGPGSDDYEECQALVAAGLMSERNGSELSGGASIFCVTESGIDYVARYSQRLDEEAK